MPIRQDLRNVAIVAHVDHGKTTLVDAMLWQSGAFREGSDVNKRVMDSMDLEREKGITILAKNTAVRHQMADGREVTINIIDTPGHADFGGEVERGLEMVDGVVLLVDASEGPLPQTRFVLRKALAKKLPLIVVVNKVDRSDARISAVVEETYDLFMDLLDDDAADALDFPIVYASAKAGRASLAQPADGGMPDSENLEPLFETILENVPATSYEEGATLQAHVTNLDASPYLGRLALCRVVAGKLRRGQQVAWCRHDGSVQNVKLTELLMTEALDRVPAEQAGPGDIVAIAGIPEITIGETLSDPNDPKPLPLIHVDEPSISMTIGINTSPMAGRVITQLMGLRRGRMEQMVNHGTGWVRMEFLVPARGLIGFRTEFLTETRGTGIMNHVAEGYEPWAGDFRTRPTGSLVADRTGAVTSYALFNLQERGTMFVGPGAEVYEGMVVGENPRPEDMDVNPTKEKKLTNGRSSTGEELERLIPPRLMAMEPQREFCASDECLEVTPAVVRIRKVVLGQKDRVRLKRG